VLGTGRQGRRSVPRLARLCRSLERRRAGAPAAVRGGVELERARGADRGPALRAGRLAIALERHPAM